MVQRFQERGLRFPRRQYGGAWDGKLIWSRLTLSRVLGMLANPSYTGTYVFGRHQCCKQVGSTGDIQKGRREESHSHSEIPSDESRNGGIRCQ